MDSTKTAGVEALAPYARGELQFGIVSLTGPEAQVAARDLACEDSRELDVEYVGELRDILERDEWVGRDGLVFVAGDDGQLTLIDGRHRLHAHGECERLADGPVRREWLVQVVRGIEPREAYRRIQRQNPFQGHARARPINRLLPQEAERVRSVSLPAAAPDVDRVVAASKPNLTAAAEATRARSLVSRRAGASRGSRRRALPGDPADRGRRDPRPSPPRERR